MTNRIFGAFCASLMVLGCGPHKEEILGNWRGEIGPDPHEIGMTSSGIAGPFGAPSVTFLSDDTFTLHITMFPVQGTWTLKGDRVLLYSSSISGARAWARRDERGQEVVELRVAGDGDSLVLIPGRRNQEPLVFLRR